MRKTSVYLPEDLKVRLTNLARATGRSEAELIRGAVEGLVGRTVQDRPVARTRTAGISGPRLFGVGVGPSDPELITARAVSILTAVDRVFAHTTAPDAISRAEAIVRAATPEVVVDRLPLEIAPGDAGRAGSVEASAGQIVAALDRRESVAVVTLGDPNVFSTFSAVAREVAALRPDVPIETTPGIMAFQELGAATATVIAEGDETVVVIALGDDPSAVERYLDSAKTSVVIYKGGRSLPPVAQLLRARDRLAGAVVGEMLGLPGGRQCPLSEVSDRPSSYLATTIVPAVRRQIRTRRSRPAKQ